MNDFPQDMLTERIRRRFDRVINMVELAGLILIEADNLDGALASAEELLGETRSGTAIEVRPVLGGRFRGA